jgi:hypothetical protein
MQFNPAALLEQKSREKYFRGDTPIWSFSSLELFKQCPARIKKKQVDGLPDPSGPAAERGTLIHDQCEEFVRGTREKLPDAKKIKWFEERFNQLRELFKEGKVEMEENWGFTVDWVPCTWQEKDILWHRSKLDVMIRHSETSAKLIDHKTGKKFGNSMKHNQQGISYTIDAFMRYPELDYVEYEFWYLDVGDVMAKSLTREQAMLLKVRLEARALEMTTATEYPANPCESSCRWCPYKEDGQCEDYVRWQRSLV